MTQTTTSAGIAQNPVLCAVTVASKNSRSVFTPLRYQCEKKAKFKVTYNNAVNGKVKTENVCAAHKNSLVTWAKKMRNKTGYDVKMVVECLNGA